MAWRTTTRRQMKAVVGVMLYIALTLILAACGAPEVASGQASESGSQSDDNGYGYGSEAPRTQQDIANLPLHALPRLADNFPRYRKDIKVFLRQRSMPHRSAAEIALNLPFEFKANSAVAYKGKFLLLHGLNDSPYAWLDLANELVNRGFDVRAPLFEGHGSTPKAMLEVSYKDWLRTAREHLHQWWEQDTPMYIGGFSMGAVIATLLAIETTATGDSTDNKDELAGLLLISPAFHSRLNHYLRWSGLYAKFKPWVFGGMILEDNPAKYNSIPVNSGWQFYKATRLLKRKLRNRQLDLPVLMVNTENDSVVDTNVTRTIFRQHFTAENRKLLTYHENPLPVSSTHEQYRLSSVPGTRILNQSHLGIMYRPENPLFGKDGSILVCNGNEYPVFRACMRASNHWLGAQHTESPDGTPVARITFNSDFTQLMSLLDRVLLTKQK